MLIDLFIDILRIALSAIYQFIQIALPQIIFFTATPILFVIYRIVAAKKLSEVAKMRGHRGKRFFVLPLLFGLPGFIYIATLPDLKMKELKQAAKMALIIEKESVSTTKPNKA